MKTPRLRLPFMFLLGLCALLSGCRHTAEAAKLSQEQFLEAFRTKEIYNGYITSDPISPSVHKVTGLLRRAENQDDVFFISYIVLSDKLRQELMASGRFQTR